MCLLIKRQDFLAGLSKSLPFEIVDTNAFDPHPWRKSLTLEESTHYLSNPNSDIGNNKALRISFKEQASSATLWMIDEMQPIFQLTQNKTYLLANLAFDSTKSLNYIPYDSPVAVLVAGIASHFRVHYGWMEPDFYGTPDDYALWHQTDNSPIQIYPWTYPSQSVFLGSEIITYLNNRHIGSEVLGQHGIILPNGVLLTPKADSDRNSPDPQAKETIEFSSILSSISSHLKTYEILDGKGRV